MGSMSSWLPNPHSWSRFSHCYDVQLTRRLLRRVTDSPRGGYRDVEAEAMEHKEASLHLDAAAEASHDESRDAKAAQAQL
jgi:hypothetical protein